MHSGVQRWLSRADLTHDILCCLDGAWSCRGSLPRLYTQTKHSERPSAQTCTPSDHPPYCPRTSQARWVWAVGKKMLNCLSVQVEIGFFQGYWNWFITALSNSQLQPSWRMTMNSGFWDLRSNQTDRISSNLRWITQKTFWELCSEQTFGRNLAHSEKLRFRHEVLQQHLNQSHLALLPMYNSNDLSLHIFVRPLFNDLLTHHNHASPWGLRCTWFDVLDNLLSTSVSELLSPNVEFQGNAFRNLLK